MPAGVEGGAVMVRIGIRNRRLLAEPVAFEEKSLSATVRLLLLLAGALVACFIVWAWITPIDEVAAAPGQVIPSGEVKLIQHLEGGVVGRVMVAEGEMVATGQVLLRMDPAQARADLDQVSVRSEELEMRIERLRAVIENRDPDFTPWAGRPILVANQQHIWSNQRASHHAALEVIESQISQRRSELAQLHSAVDIASQQLSITTKQLAIRKRGVAEGVVSREIYLETQRAKVAAVGELNRLRDQIQVNTNALAEAERRRENQRMLQRQDVLIEIGSASDELEQVRKTMAKLNDRVQRLDIRSPVDGFVQDIKIHAPGEVILPGGMVMRVVPINDNLKVSSRISSTDIGHIRPQQPVRLRVSSYDYARYGAIPGVLEQVSPTTFVDELGKPYYKGIIALQRTFMGPGVDKNPILPGMIVQADIMTGRKTLLEYLTKPVVLSLRESFHER